VKGEARIQFRRKDCFVRWAGASGNREGFRRLGDNETDQTRAIEWGRQGHVDVVIENSKNASQVTLLFSSTQKLRQVKTVICFSSLPVQALRDNPREQAQLDFIHSTVHSQDDPQVCDRSDWR
jgi:hypothetical protein